MVLPGMPWAAGQAVVGGRRQLSEGDSEGEGGDVTASMGVEGAATEWAGWG